MSRKKRRNTNRRFAVKNAGGPGRPRRAVEPEYLAALAEDTLSDEQIADTVGIGRATLAERIIRISRIESKQSANASKPRFSHRVLHDARKGSDSLTISGRGY